MPMPVEPWRSKLQPASFRSAGFHVDVSSYLGGRRTVTHEFPKRDIPQGEDMGRRAKRFSIAAYIVDADYFTLRDALISALETEGPGTLVHPYLGQFQVNVEPPFNVIERRERGRMCEIEITFVEAGDTSNSSAANTQADAASATSNASTVNASTLQFSTTQSGITGTNNAGFGSIPAGGFLGTMGTNTSLGFSSIPTVTGPSSLSTTTSSPSTVDV